MRHLRLLRDSMKRILLHGQRGLQNMNGYAQKGILIRLGNCVHNCILLRLSLVSLLMRHQCLLWRLCYYIRKASAWYSLSKLLLICMLAFLLIAYYKKMGSSILFFFFFGKKMML